jgi:hypothetical protein
LRGPTDQGGENAPSGYTADYSRIYGIVAVDFTLNSMKIVATSNMVEARTTPHGFWRFSADYLLAARIVEVKICEEGHLFFPTLQLYGIAIELALKAFLLKRGLTINEVRSLSHNLTKALALARRHKLGIEVKLDRREIAAIQILDMNYSNHRLRYIVTGATKTPQLVYIERAAISLVVGLEFLCTGAKGRLDHAV